ncbi:uncharacterized protein [Dysidea avara]|uniref:uncharacterized protein n=1 Tax=Dysidea avara TaxID=196820 RepID=UPI00331EE292
MGVHVLMLLLAIATCSDAASLEPTCVKIDECSCHLTGVEQPGVIDLHSLVSGEHEPTFTIQAKSEQTNLTYNYSYNPCMIFSTNSCPNTSMCQTGDKVESYNLGNLETVEFVFRVTSVFAVYHSKHDDKHGQNRTSEVELICDEDEMKGRFEYDHELSERHYMFKLFTQCACPGKCTSSQTECQAKDLCSCEMSDGSGTINLHSLDNATSPLRDEASPTNTFLYNPCSPITKPDCKGNSLCEEKGDDLVGLGMANSAKFVQNNNQLSIQYTGPNGNMSYVNLFCDENQRNKPFCRAVGKGNVYDLYSVCACPNGCSGPPSNGTCDQTDSCTCKSTSDGAVINLHDLDNPSTPLTAEDNEGYFYYYNPCSGIKLQNTLGKCNGVAACQYDPYHGLYYDIGNIGPEIHYNATSKSFTFHYTGGQENRSFDVRMICDPDVASTILLPDDDIPKGVTMYPLKLISKYACPQ